jgi:hypothetical protein
MDDGMVLAGCMNAQGQSLNADSTEFCTFFYPHAATCFGSGDTTEKQDAMFFGTADGYVMEEDRGTSFDGALIESVIRLHFNHFKNPSVKKRFRKMVVEIDSPASVEIGFKQIFDYDDGFLRPSVNQYITVTGVGGVWGGSGWDTFYWSMPNITQGVANIDGYGKNMGLLITHSSSFDSAFILQGLLIHYSPLGLER